MTDVRDRKDMGVVLVTCTLSNQTVEPVHDAQTASITSLSGVASPAGSPANEADNSPHKQKSFALSSHQGLDRVVSDILTRGGYGGVEVGYCRDRYPSVEEAITRVISQGARQVVVVPAVIATVQVPPCECFMEASPNNLRQRVAKTQACHPDRKIVYAEPPFDHERLVDLILSKIREYEPPAFKTGLTQLNDLRGGEMAVVRELDGGPHFRSRMAALGFTPGALVKMVQNYGHGAVIVSLRGARVALGRGEARKVGVSRAVGDGYPVI
jgi:ferrous iron transport protein A